MWKYLSNHKNNDVSLHDCRATRIFIQKNNLYFEFNKGFWVFESNLCNTNNKTFQSDISQVRIKNFDYDDCCLYLFKQKKIFRKLVNTKRIPITLESLVNNVNSGKWELEFLYKYDSYKSVLFECYIWFNQKPYCMECQLKFYCDDIDYMWNNIYEDNPW